MLRSPESNKMPVNCFDRHFYLVFDHSSDPSIRPLAMNSATQKLFRRRGAGPRRGVEAGVLFHSTVECAAHGAMALVLSIPPQAACSGVARRWLPPGRLRDVASVAAQHSRKSDGFQRTSPQQPSRLSKCHTHQSHNHESGIHT